MLIEKKFLQQFIAILLNISYKLMKITLAKGTCLRNFLANKKNLKNLVIPAILAILIAVQVIASSHLIAHNFQDNHSFKTFKTEKKSNDCKLCELAIFLKKINCASAITLAILLVKNSYLSFLQNNFKIKNSYTANCRAPPAV